MSTSLIVLDTPVIPSLIRFSLLSMGSTILHYLRDKSPQMRFCSKQVLARLLSNKDHVYIVHLYYKFANLLKDIALTRYELWL